MMHDHYKVLRVLAATLLAASIDASLMAQVPPPWTDLLPSQRVNHAMAYDSLRGVSVMFGGGSLLPNSDHGDTWEWDGNSWTHMGSTGPSARYAHAMAYDSQRGVTVLFGGFNNFSGTLGDTWEWDGSSWTQVASTGPSPRHNHAMAYDSQRGVTVLFGGWDGANNLVDDTWEWDGTTWTRVVSTGASGRIRHAMAYDSARGVTVLFGGLGVLPLGGTGLLGDTWEWDGTTWTQVATPGPPARANHAMAYDSQGGRTVLLGGQDSSSNLFDETWEWDGSSWMQVATTGPLARNHHAMAYDSLRGVTVLFGGNDNTFITRGDTWEWDRTAWTQVATGGPWIGFSYERAEHAMAYDSQRGRTVLFGGLDNQWAFAGTWEWDGTSWTNVSPTTGTGPDARFEHAMAYDSQRGVTVMFGGDNQLGFLNETWEWDGNSWTPVANTTAGPTPRRDHAMAYDSARGVTVVFGGEGAPSSYLGDTWEWDGNSWAQVATTGPSTRSGHAMAYDDRRGRTVLFGGHDTPSNYLGDTWEWDGNSWAQAIVSGPPARIDHAMAYDDGRGHIVLFGGRDLSPYLFGDTWEWASDYASVATTFGTGCGNPALALSPVPSARPTVGTTAQVALTNVPTSPSIAFVALGWSRTTTGSLALPLPLAGLGMPGCDLLQSAEAAAVPTAITGPGTADFSAPLPAISGLIGLEVYLQGWAVAPSFNPAGVIVSNGVEWVIGNT